MRVKATVIALFFLAAIALPALASDLWYEDNNLGKGNGMPPDFVEKFRQPENFSQMTKYIHVYTVRAKVLHVMDNQYFSTLRCGSSVVNLSELKRESTFGSVRCASSGYRHVDQQLTRVLIQ